MKPNRDKKTTSIPDDVSLEDSTAKSNSTAKEDVDFAKTNPGGAVDTLNDEDRIPNPGNNINIVGGTADDLSKPIPEAEFTKRTVDISGTGPVPGTEPSPQPGRQAPPPKPAPEPGFTIPPPPPIDAGPKSFNPGYDDIPPPPPPTGGEETPLDFGDDALATADFIHSKVARPLIQSLPSLFFTKRKWQIRKLHDKGKINKNALLQIGPDVFTVQQVVDNWNSTLKGNSNEVDIPQEWITENNPLLAHILKKNKGVMSVEMRYGMGCIVLGAHVVQGMAKIAEKAGDFMDYLEKNTKPAPMAPVPAAGPATADINSNTAAAPKVDPEIVEKQKEDISKTVSEAVKNAGKEKAARTRVTKKKETVKELVKD